MSEPQTDPTLVARCGLYCGACRSFLKGKCPGCRENTKASWCRIRSCCGDLGIPTCAQCPQVSDPMGCTKFNNFISKVFGFVFRSDRGACIRQIKELGLEGHAARMAASRSQTIRKGRA